MLITVTLNTGRKIPFRFELHCAIDAMVAALKENIPNWEIITITIDRVVIENTINEKA